MMGDAAKPFRILSLDGGGIRGVFSAGFLAELEQQLGGRVGDYFDLVAGTSTGGIIAAGLAMGIPAAQIEQFYFDFGPAIFTRHRPKWSWRRWLMSKLAAPALRRFRVDFDQFICPKYDSTVLRAALEEVFGDATIEDCKTRLVIPALDLTRAQPIVFKTPHFPGLFRDRRYSIVDVLMSTAAAPTYFPHAVIDEGSVYVDGGMWANNPSIVAVAEAMRIRRRALREDLDLPIDLDAVYLLSVGTGSASYVAEPPDHGGGLAWWGSRLFTASSTAQSQGIDAQIRYLLDDRTHRVDVALPDQSWQLDNVKRIAQLSRIGHERCVERLESLRPTFFGAPRAHPYHPFDINGQADPEHNAPIAASTFAAPPNRIPPRSAADPAR